MYEAFFGLSRRPFDTSPDPSFLFLASTHREALAALEYAAVSGIGLMTIIGEVGLGKTTVLRAFQQKLVELNASSISVSFPQISFDDLLAMIMAELKLPKTDQSPAQCLEEIRTSLVDLQSKQRRFVLIIDEAQSLPVDTLESIRLLTNIETDTAKLFQIILAGQPEFEAILAETRWRPLEQRIQIKVKLTPLSTEESLNYLEQRLQTAGSRNPVDALSLSAMQAIVRLGGGTPRKLNILSNLALVEAMGRSERPVSEETVATVARSLGEAKSAGWSVGKLLTSSGGYKWVALAACALILVAGGLAYVAFGTDGPLEQQILALWDGKAAKSPRKPVAATPPAKQKLAAAAEAQPSKIDLTSAATVPIKPAVPNPEPSASIPTNENTTATTGTVPPTSPETVPTTTAEVSLPPISTPPSTSLTVAAAPVPANPLPPKESADQTGAVAPVPKPVAAAPPPDLTAGSALTPEQSLNSSTNLTLTKEDFDAALSVPIMPPQLPKPTAAPPPAVLTAGSALAAEQSLDGSTNLTLTKQDFDAALSIPIVAAQVPKPAAVFPPAVLTAGSALSSQQGSDDSTNLTLSKDDFGSTLTLPAIAAEPLRPIASLPAPVMVTGSALSPDQSAPGLLATDPTAAPNAVPWIPAVDTQLALALLQVPVPAAEAPKPPTADDKRPAPATNPTQPQTPPATKAPALQLAVVEPNADATQVVASFQEALKITMINADQLGMDGRYKALAPVVQRTFDLKLLSKIIAGNDWSGWSEDQRTQLSQTLGRYVTALYAKRFDGYLGEKFQIDNTRKAPNGTLVQTTMLRPSDPATSITYVLSESPDEVYRITDVLLSGTTSELASRRAEFGSVLKQSGFSGLIKILNEKADYNG